MRVIKLLLFLFLPSLLIAQGPIFEKVQQSKDQKAVTQFSLVKTTATSFMTAGIQDEVSKGILLDLDKNEISLLKAEQPELIQLNFPLSDEENIQVDLVKNKVLSEDFILRLSSNPEQYTKYKAGAYYHGVVSDDPNTLVSISIFEEEIIGSIMTKAGNYVIGKVKGTDKHIIYNDQNLEDATQLDCETEDDGQGYHPSQLSWSGERSVGDCIRVYIEIDDDIVTNKGGATAATNYITGLFNQTITLYANDGLTMVVSEIKAWDTPAPYSGSSSSAMLNSYQANTGSFNGDLSHLVSYQASGGIAAGFSGICNSNPDNSKCFSSIDATYNNVPQYSFSVMVTTHEMGHLIGSRHTHACVWNGNNTAIDGCAGQTEGSCSLPGSPSGGGTIMSYCHLTTGIDFNLGFGTQPQAVILNTVNNANCLSNCGSGSTCNDGIQNGQETGVDCGGPDCAPCPTGCNDNEVTITINFDNYPEETTWDVKDASGTVVGSGGPYGSQPDGSTLSTTLCLIDGCYDFIIYDSYGDGICCGYGNGSYSVTDQGGNVLASGGSFGSSETTNFCQNPPPTCSDVDVTINFDNYPEETTWDVKDASGAVVGSGGPYGSQPDGSTLTTTLCLFSGCYDFTIYDSYGDGICCGYGNGSYSVTEGGNVLASGGSFGSSETTNFCLGSSLVNPEDLSNTIMVSTKLSIHPNPANNVLNINSDKIIESLQIISISGQLVKTIQVGDNYEELDISSLQGGMYYLLIKAEGELITEKFIKL